MTQSDPKFQIEHQYQSYLKRVGLTEAQMGDIQRTETRRAFYAGCGQMLVLLRDDVAAIEDEMEAVNVLADMAQQAIKFWQKSADESVRTE